jgi:hypothetical protein
MNNSAVDECIGSRILTWKFPKPNGGVVKVSYSFEFQ